MEETKILFETAKLAKEKGFNLLCSAYYAFDYSEEEWILLGENSPSFINNRETHFAAPTQSLLQKWLREKHKIELYVIPVIYNNRYMVKGIIRHDIWNHELFVNEWNDTYEGALEVGLVEALKLI